MILSDKESDWANTLSILAVTLITFLTQLVLSEKNIFILTFIILLATTLVLYVAYAITIIIGIVLYHRLGKEEYHKKIETFNATFPASVIRKIPPHLIGQGMLTFPVTIFALILANILSHESLLQNAWYLPGIYLFISFLTLFVKSKKITLYLAITGIIVSLFMISIQSFTNIHPNVAFLPFVLSMCIVWSFITRQWY